MKLLLLLVSLTSTLVLYGQSTFELKTIGSKYSTDEIEAAFTSANFCGSFFETKRNVLTFDDGAVIELKSRQELLTEGIISMSDDCFIDDSVHYYESVWTIDPTGRLLKGFDTNAYPSEKEYFHYKN